MTRDQSFIDIEKATVRGLSCTELVRMVKTPKPKRSVPRLDAKLLRDIGLDRSFS